MTLQRSGTFDAAVASARDGGVTRTRTAAAAPGLADLLYEHVRSNRAMPALDLQLLPWAPATASAPSAPGAEAVRSPREQRPVAVAPGATRPASLTPSDITAVADQVARVLKQRERTDRERRGVL